MRQHSSTWAALVWVLAVSIPLAIHNPYYIHLVETIMIYSILLFGLDIVVGYTGQVSLGHAGLFGIGAYTAGVMFMKLSASVWLVLPCSIAVTAVFGAILALPALRVSGPYLAMVTLAFGTIIQILINEMTFLTEGPLGIKISKPILFGEKLSEREFYWVVCVMLGLALIFVHRVLRSHLGRAFEALKGSPVASDCMGVSVYRYKVYAFVVSAGLAGLAGSLYAYSEQYISPNTYNFELTVLFLLAIIMGGRKTRSGAIIGASIIVMLPKLLDDIELFRWVATTAAVVIAAGAVTVDHAQSRGHPGGGHLDLGRLLLPTPEHDRLAFEYFWADDFIRGVLLARRHCGFPLQVESLGRHRWSSIVCIDFTREPAKHNHCLECAWRQ